MYLGDNKSKIYVYLNVKCSNDLTELNLLMEDCYEILSDIYTINYNFFKFM